MEELTRGARRAASRERAGHGRESPCSHLRARLRGVKSRHVAAGAATHADGRAARRAVDGRAGAGRRGRRARQPVRRRPPQRAGALLPERRDPRAACWRSGTSAPRVRCSSCRSGIRCCSPSRSARSPSIARGPFVLQCAVGGGEEQFRVFDTTLRERAERFEAGLDIIRALCRGETVTVTDGPWTIDRGAASRPSRPSRSRSGSAPPRRAAIDRAARLGDAFLIGPEATPAEVAALVREVPRRVRAARPHADPDRRRAATSTSPRPTNRRRAVAGSDHRARATGASTRRPSCRGAGSGRRRVRRARRRRLHRRHRAPPRRRSDRGAAVVRAARDGAGTTATCRVTTTPSCDVISTGQAVAVEPLWIDAPAQLAELVGTLARRAALRARHRIPRRALVLAAPGADPDRVARRHRARRPADGRSRPARRRSSPGPGCMVAHAADQDLVDPRARVRLCAVAAVRHPGRRRVHRYGHAVARRDGREVARHPAHQRRPAHRLDAPPAAASSSACTPRPTSSTCSRCTTSS